MSQVPSPLPKTVSHEDLLIRRMRTADIPEIMLIESVSFGRHHWSPESFSFEIKNQVGRYYTLLYKPENKIIGYCGYWIVLDEGHITTIAIDPTFRGNGLGELLLVKMLDRMSGQSVKWATLEVRVSNFSAQQLYYKYHFRTLGVRSRYYQDTNEDALIMTTESIQDKSFRIFFKEVRQKLANRLGGKLPEGAD